MVAAKSKFTGIEFGPGILAKQLLIQEELGFLEFDGENVSQKYGYMKASGVLRTLNKAMSKHGVVMAVVSESAVTEYGDHLKNNVSIVHQTVRYTCVTTGDFFECQSVGGGKDSHDKGPMKGSTAALKYNIAHPFCLGWDAEDPEGKNDAVGQEARASKKASKAKKSSFDAIAAIDAAKDVATLDALKVDLVNMAEGADKNAARAAFTTKRESLSQ